MVAGLDKRASYVITGIAFEHSKLLRKPRLTRLIAKLGLQELIIEFII